MAAFLVRRVLSGLLLVGLLTFLTFFVFNEIPTNPACLVVACGPHTTTNDAQIRAADHELGIDRSLFVQYGDFVWKLVSRGDLGTAWTSKENVGQAIGHALPVTASLVAGGMVLMLLLALPLGAIAALRPRSSIDRGLLAFSVIGLAIHPFVLGLTIATFSYKHFHIISAYCPLTGKSPPFACGGPVDWASHLVIPWVVFALLFLPFYMRMLRVRLLETFSEPYISTARAKGASETRVVFGHAMRNAIGPVLPMLAIDAGTAITAAIYVETVFGLPGLGQLAVSAFSGKAGGYDLPLTAGIVVVIGAFVVLLNVCADVAGAWLDPRIRAKTSTGLIPLPRAVASHPRARIALNVAVAGALIAVLAVAVTHRSSGGHGFDLGKPVRTIHADWRDVTPLKAQVGSVNGAITEEGSLITHVTAIEFGKYGWQVHASIENKSPLTLQLFSPHGNSGFRGSTYPNQPMSLIVQTDNGGGIRQLQPLEAKQFTPALPQTFEPNTTWSGTFAGADTVKSGTTFYVGFGQFVYVGVDSQQAFSTSTAKSGTSP
jgi:peptide/nickel transport system permease protein